jgi:hypothetical protein
MGGKTANIAKIVTSQVMAVLAVLIVGLMYDNAEWEA